MGLYEHDEYVEMTVHFKCNLKCKHCMIEDTMDRLKPESMDSFHHLLETNARERKWKGLILTGSEVTLRKDLPQLAQEARRSGFEHVRIQTHGMRFAKRDYCKELIDAGVDEFFVSVTAGDAETHDHITKVKGSFRKTMQGLDNLDEFSNIALLTNTVITALSYQQLPTIVKRLSHLKNLVQMDFWTYWPMSEEDDKDLIVSHLDVLPYLKDTIRLCGLHNRAIDLKNYPECLLGDERSVLSNGQPKLMIDQDFWNEFSRNGFHQCIYKDRCTSLECLGLNTAYVRKFGWMEHDLKPYLPTI